MHFGRIVTKTLKRAEGINAAALYMQQFLLRFRYMLLCDVCRSFETVGHHVLKALCRRRVQDRAVLARFIDLLLPGDEPGKGVPIDNLTGHNFANLYLEDWTLSSRIAFAFPHKATPFWRTLGLASKSLDRGLTVT